MTQDLATVLQQVHALVDEYRQRCLWFWRDDYYPETAADALRALQAIERHGDVAALRKLAPLKQWLSLHSSERSAA